MHCFIYYIIAFLCFIIFPDSPVYNYVFSYLNPKSWGPFRWYLSFLGKKKSEQFSLLIIAILKKHHTVMNSPTYSIKE